MFSQGQTHKTATQLYFVCEFPTTNYWLMISSAKSTLCKMLPKVLNQLKRKPAFAAEQEGCSCRQGYQHGKPQSAC